MNEILNISAYKVSGLSYVETIEIQGGNCFDSGYQLGASIRKAVDSCAAIKFLVELF